MSTTRDIAIEDQYGRTLHVMHDGVTITATILCPPGSADGTAPSIELDETDRRDLTDFLSAR